MMTGISFTHKGGTVAYYIGWSLLVEGIFISQGEVTVRYIDWYTTPPWDYTILGYDVVWDFGYTGNPFDEFLPYI